MLSVLAVLLSLVATDPSPAKTPADRGMEMMQALPPLTGHWKGGGTIRMGTREPVSFVGEETVETRLDGRVVLIEGKHFLPDRSRMVHHAFAMLTYDEQAGGYRFRTHLSNGRGGEYPARMENGALIWEMDSPQGRTEYIITIEDDEWKEIGRIERDGEWHDFFEMKLRRTSE